MASGGLQASYHGINCPTTQNKINSWKGGKCTEIFYGSAATLAGKEVVGSKDFKGLHDSSEYSGKKIQIKQETWKKN